MSKRQILRSIAKKGLSFEVCEYERQPTPRGMIPGWTVQLDEQSIELALDYGANSDDLFDCDFENVNEVLEWIESLPDCYDGASAAEETRP